jgi:toxin-antitoxin system PIN domain toxin
MSRTVDVNVLVYATEDTLPHHRRARALLEHLATDPSITYLFWPVLIGYFRIITHPGIMPKPLPPATVVDDIEQLINRPQIVVPGESDRFWRVFRDIAASVQPRGNLVPDAHLVALMREHGVMTLWSNDRDFRKFDKIEVRNPFDEAFDGF